MSSDERCGIYVIEHSASGKQYIGSSKSIRSRWHGHRDLLRKGKHHSRYLQNAWKKYGEGAFEFRVLGDCGFEELLRKEQQYMEAFKPVFNVASTARVIDDPGIRAKMLASLRARCSLMTHCPHGHLYDEKNTYRDKRGKRCRICNTERLKKIRSLETSEQRDARRKQIAKYNANSVVQKEKRRLYALAHKAEKREYDRLLRLRKKSAPHHHAGATLAVGSL